MLVAPPICLDTAPPYSEEAKGVMRAALRAHSARSRLIQSLCSEYAGRLLAASGSSLPEESIFGVNQGVHDGVS